MLFRSVFPDKNNFNQRLAVKQLVLMAINANDKKTAFSAFRSDQPTGHPSKKLTNVELSQLLDAFIERYPRLEQFLCTGKGLELMYTDSCIAEYVIDHFTKLGVPILDRKSTRLNSSHKPISYAVFCLKKKKNSKTTNGKRTDDEQE